ncbi:lysozyme inhibitor LprI family protein [Niallia taxi]|uniref:lysozyme inhibitor LprI family protein n=1 Tax=Niallia taxi TaxID=2499688 RepID=UPI00254E119A|nr:lysozyme inhibitor LprI family protein [Niallia taxi]MDK8641554.1 lysozyme inhibitor LprI family protein [Niallia taxi]
MKKSKKIFSTTLLVVFLVGMSACNKSSIDDSNKNKSEPNNTSKNTDTFNGATTDDNSINNLEEEDNTGTNNNSDNETSTNSISDVNGNEFKSETSTPDKMDKKREEVLDNIQTELTAFPDKIEGSRKEFLERLDNIQRELDSLPDKKFSDTGTTNAMKNYYGISDEKYDIALNRIYDLLKQELTPETMESLKMEQIKWIERKEAEAENERQKYAGKTHEWVAYYISSYELTKERCYELVNRFMTD